MKPIKLSEYIEVLQGLYKEFGDKLPLYYASDDEGNDFHPVLFVPGAVMADDCTDRVEGQVICIN